MADLSETDKLFSVSTNKTVSTTELTFLLFRNPSGSGKTCKIKGFLFANVHTIADSFVRYRVYNAPTVTSDGTALTENPLDIGSGVVASGTAFLTPSVSANGTLILDFSAQQGRTFPTWFPDGFQLRANQQILITIVSDGASRVAAGSLIWEED